MVFTNHGLLHHAGGGRKGSNVNYIRQVPKFLQGHMHLLGARNDEDVQEQLAAKREMPQWDSEDDDAADKEVDIHVPSAIKLCYRKRRSCVVPTPEADR